MARSEPPAAVPDVPAHRWDAVVSILPLGVAAAALFLGAYVAYVSAPAAGPRIFPLWDLLFVLGLLAVIGAGLTVAIGEEASGRPAPAEAPSSSASGDRSEFGRPRPAATPGSVPMPTGGLAVAVTSLGGRPALPAIWSEDDLPLPAPRRAPVRRPVETETSVATAPAPPPRTAVVENALAEIEDIQRDIAPRRPTDAAVPP